MNISETYKKLKRREKIALLSGKGMWRTKDIERINLPSAVLADGPLGLRVQPEGAHSINQSLPSTTLPSPALLACSFDRELMYRAGALLGSEARARGVSLVLAPGVNIKRSPLCGRNFEYYSEDPHLSSHLAGAFIRGIQSKGVGACIKHFAVNNQEKNRTTLDVKVSRRALHEIYLKSFEYAVKSARPWAVMAAYNSVNGKFCSQNDYLLTEVLRKRWGYKGLTVSDWNGVYDRVAALNAGLDLEMPSSNGYFDKSVSRALIMGEIPGKRFKQAVTNILELVQKAEEGRETEYSCNYDAHYSEVRSMAAESTVLLKNEDILPLRSGDTVAVIGEFAFHPRTQGNGSSHTVPHKQDNLADELKLLMGGGVEYAQGYSTLDSKPSARLEDQAVGLALRQDKVVLMLGLPDSWESESFDRTHINLPENQLRLLEKLSAANKNIIAVLVNGSPIDLSALSGCKAVIEGYLGGAASGGALADVLYGVVNPSGRLAETLPLNIQNTPAYQNFGGPEREIEYKEDIFVGYRHYGTKKVPVAYPFGYGLSYTQFGYSALKLKDDLDGRGELTVNFQLQNTGSYAGKEAVQIYVRPPVDMPVACAERELKQFAKVSLRPKETQTVSLTLRREDFAYFDEKSDSWRVHGGEYTIMVGKNSLESALEKTLHITGDPVRRTYFTEESTLGELAQDADGKKFIDFMVENFRRPGQGIDIAAEEGSTEQRFFYTTALKLLPPASDGALSASALRFIINAINKKGWRLRLLNRFMAKQKKRIELEAQLKEQQADYRQISEDAPPAETTAEIIPQTENAPQPEIQTENAAADNDSAGHDLAEQGELDLNIGGETQNADIATEENFAETDGAADTAPDFTDTDNIQESQTALDNADNAAETDIILPDDLETIDEPEAVTDTQSEQQTEQPAADSQNTLKQPESDE